MQSGTRFEDENCVKTKQTEHSRSILDWEGMTRLTSATKLTLKLSVASISFSSDGQKKENLDDREEVNTPKSFCQIFPSSSFLYPIVVSENRSLATSSAMFAPDKAEQETPSRSSITSAKMCISAPLTSTPYLVSFSILILVMLEMTYFDE